ncbi:MAG: histidine kinase [Actinomycetaceae bacterium]|nr:histidine kinase [Actinomycetaceae bacterium]
MPAVRPQHLAHKRPILHGGDSGRDKSSTVLFIIWLGSLLCTVIVVPLNFINSIPPVAAVMKMPFTWEWFSLVLSTVSPFISHIFTFFAIQRKGIVLPILGLITGLFSFTFISYAAALSCYLIGRRAALKGIAITVIVATLSMIVSIPLMVPLAPRDLFDIVVNIIVLDIVGIAVTLIGVLMRTQDALETSRVAAAKIEERARISREIHDSLAHRLSLVSLHATALSSRRDLDPELMRESTQTIQTLAAEAGRELRQILRVLHGDGTPDQAGARREAIAVAIRRERDAGQKIRFHCESGWDRAFESADMASRHAVVRVVEEALTNARRHGSGRTVDLSLTSTRRALVVECSNPTHRRSSSHTGGTGLGLAGLRERVRLLGGDLQAGARDGIFTLEASIPRREGRA